jgi:ComF family protein
MRFLWNYEKEARDLLVTVKYKPSYALAKFVTAALATAFDTLYPLYHWDTIVSIPASRQSRQVRPFNLGAMLARQVADHLKTTRPLALENSAITHRGYRAPQASLQPEERFSNVRNAFSIRDNVVSEKRVLLVEDVVTTGATTNVVTNLLLSHGAISVDVVCLARSPSWNEFRQSIHSL